MDRISETRKDSDACQSRTTCNIYRYRWMYCQYLDRLDAILARFVLMRLVIDLDSMFMREEHCRSSRT